MKRIVRTTLVMMLLVGICSELFAQRAAGGNFRQRKKPDNPFFNTQLWLGIKFGGNLARATPTERYAVFTSTLPDDALAFEKTYDGYGQASSQIGLVSTFNFKKYFSISFQPAYKTLHFGYQNQYNWAGQANNSVQLTQQHRVAMSYVDLPLLMRFDVFRTRFRPYLQGGLFYSRLAKADKFTTINSYDQASGAVNPIENTSPVIGAKRLFINSQWGWIGGVGVSYDVGNVRLGLDAAYKQGLNNITNAPNRYTDDRLTSTGDVMDDLKLNNVEISFSCVFPMKFLIVKNFRSVKP